MTLPDVAVVVIAACSLAAVVLAAVALAVLARSLHALRAAVDALHIGVDELRTEAVSAAGELTGAVRAGAAGPPPAIVRDVGERAGTTLVRTARLAPRPLSEPVIKVLAVASGTSRAARRFRQRRLTAG